jgi:SHAQKYF class myb-like DNA-binding protein
MDCVLKTDSNIDNAAIPKSLPKKDRVGRWTQSEAYLFETLLERHGKNWKKIHQYMKGRTLSQIRSHGQKFFGKIGSKKVEELSRRAKLLEAYETL